MQRWDSLRRANEPTDRRSPPETGFLIRRLEEQSMKTTLSIIKADIGSIGGRVTPATD